MKKGISVLLALSVLLSIVSCSTQPPAPTAVVDPSPAPAATLVPPAMETAAPAPTTAPGPTATETAPANGMMPYDEFQRGIWYGFVPAEIQTDLDQPVTFAQFGAMITNMLGLFDQDGAAKWQQTASLALKKTDVMKREDGMMMLFYAADALGLTALNDHPAGYWAVMNDKMGPDNWWKSMTYNYPYFPNFKESYPGGWQGQDFDYAAAAFFFSIGEQSPISGLSLLDYDPTSNSMRSKDPFTRTEAIRSAIRLYEALEFNRFIPVDQAIPFSITPETLALAFNMPVASSTSLPKWHGMTFANMGQNWRDSDDLLVVYWQQEIKDVAGLGFNFLRIPLDYSYLFADDQTSQVNNAALQNLDNLLTWAIVNNIHICLDLHTTPGLSTDANDTNDTLFGDPAQQEILVRFWTFIARRYAAVPSNALSFDLLNEPHMLNSKPLSDALYSKVMLKVIDAIRAETPDRLIFIDMLDFGATPVQGLVKSGVAQSIHFYIPGLGSVVDNQSEYNLKNNWPIYLINGLVNKKSGPLTMDGDFKAGTNVIFRLGGIHLDGTITVKADDAEIGSFPFGKEQVGENFCNNIMQAGTGGESHWYGGAGIKFTLPADAKKLTFELSGKAGWFFVDGLSIENGKATTLFYADGKAVTNGNARQNFHVDAAGAVTTDIPDTLMVMDETYFDKTLQKYADFSAKTGIQVMVQELGIYTPTANALSLKGLDTQLAEIQKYGYGWALWSNGFDFIAYIPSQKRADATFVPFGEHGWIDTEMLAMVQSHMQ